MSDFDYQLGRLQGQLDSFIYVNAKTNHSYTFEITQIDNSLELVEDTHNFLVKHYPNSQLSTNKIENWQSTVSMVLQRWLFDFVFMVKILISIINYTDLVHTVVLIALKVIQEQFSL